MATLAELYQEATKPTPPTDETLLERQMRTAGVPAPPRTSTPGGTSLADLYSPKPQEAAPPSAWQRAGGTLSSLASGLGSSLTPPADLRDLASGVLSRMFPTPEPASLPTAADIAQREGAVQAPDIATPEGAPAAGPGLLSGLMNRFAASDAERQAWETGQADLASRQAAARQTEEAARVAAGESPTGAALQRGIAGSSLGLAARGAAKLFGAEVPPVQEVPADETLVNKALGSLAGFTADLPLYVAGGKAASWVGGKLLAIPGVQRLLGESLPGMIGKAAQVFGISEEAASAQVVKLIEDATIRRVVAGTVTGAGAFGAADSVREVLREANDSIDRGESRFDIGKIVTEGGKGAVLGGAVGAVGGAFVDRPVLDFLAQTGVLGGLGPLVQGRIPTIQDLIDAGVSLAVLKGAYAVLGSRWPTEKGLAAPGAEAGRQAPGEPPLTGFWATKDGGNALGKLADLQRSATHVATGEQIETPLPERQNAARLFKRILESYGLSSKDLPPGFLQFDPDALLAQQPPAPAAPPPPTEPTPPEPAPPPVSREAPPAAEAQPVTQPAPPAKEPWAMTQEEWNAATRFYRSGKTKNAELPTGERVILKHESTPGNFREVSAHFLALLRRQAVFTALNQGKPVPSEILAEFPDMRKPEAPAAPTIEEPTKPATTLAAPVAGPKPPAVAPAPEQKTELPATVPTAEPKPEAAAAPEPSPTPPAATPIPLLAPLAATDITIYRGETPGATGLNDKGTGPGSQWSTDRSIAAGFSKEGGRIREATIKADAHILEFYNPDASVRRSTNTLIRKLTRDEFGDSVNVDYLYDHFWPEGLADKLRSAGYDIIQTRNIEGPETVVLNQKAILEMPEKPSAQAPQPESTPPAAVPTKAEVPQPKSTAPAPEAKPARDTKGAMAWIRSIPNLQLREYATEYLAYVTGGRDIAPPIKKLTVTGAKGVVDKLKGFGFERAAEAAPVPAATAPPAETKPIVSGMAAKADEGEQLLRRLQEVGPSLAANPSAAEIARARELNGQVLDFVAGVSMPKGSALRSIADRLEELTARINKTLNELERQAPAAAAPAPAELPSTVTHYLENSNFLNTAARGAYAREYADWIAGGEKGPPPIWAGRIGKSVHETIRETVEDLFEEAEKGTTTVPASTSTSWKVVVQGGSNAQRFATKDEAERAANELASRWMGMGKYTIEESTDPVNSRFDMAKYQVVPIEKPAPLTTPPAGTTLSAGGGESNVPEERPGATAAEATPGERVGAPPGELLQGVPPEAIPGPGEVGGGGELLPGAGGRGAGNVRPPEPGRAGQKAPTRGGVRTGGTTVLPGERPGGSPVAEPAPPTLSTPDKPGHDYIIRPEDAIGSGTPIQKYQQNVAAIRLVKQLLQEGRQATPEEQAVLVKYVGWGGLKNTFQRKYQWDYARGNERSPEKRRYDEVKELLTDEEWQDAAASTLNAHFTSEVVIRAMWDAVRHLGIDRIPGRLRVAETAAGIGHFYGLMPVELAARSTRTAIEMDTMSGAILGLLYPNVDAHVSPFQKTRIIQNFFHLFISNVPFLEEGVYDREYRKNRTATESLHNYYFVRSVDKAPPGGLIAYITSRYTMDSAGQDIRKMLAEKADLLGAIRLPNTAFKGNAGTEVVTDLVFLRKRGPGEAPAGAPWIDTKEVEVDGKPLMIQGRNYQDEPARINQYFVDHPEMVLGTHANTGSMYREREYTVEPIEGEDLWQQLTEAIPNLPADVLGPVEAVAPTPAESAAERIPAPADLLQGSFTVQPSTPGGKVQWKVYRKQGNVLERVDAGDATERIRSWLAIRSAWRDTIRTQLRPDATPEDLLRSQVALNRAYDAYVKAHGPLHAPKTLRSPMNDDPEFFNLLAVEKWDKETQKASKAPIFFERTIDPVQAATHAENAQDALSISLNELGRIDWDRMSALTGKSAGNLQDDLAGHVFETPSGLWETSDLYLSGLVKVKLAEAQDAARNDLRFVKNVEALTKVQPEDVPESKIDVHVASPWIPIEHLTAFALETLGLQPGDGRIVYTPATARYFVDIPNANTTQNVATWGTPDYTAVNLLDAILNHRKIEVREDQKDDRGNTQSVYMHDRTIAAQNKANELRKEFGSWVWREEGRAKVIHRAYNDTMNNVVVWQPDGSHLTFPGAAKAVVNSLYPHQRNWIWRGIVKGTGYLAGEPGTGKSFAMAAIAIESRRLGLAKKPLVAVKNNTLRQFYGQVAKMYPAARVLVPRQEEMAMQGRREFIGKIAAGDWDLIILPHSFFNLVPVSQATVHAYYDEQIDELLAILAELGGQDPRFTNGRSREPGVREVQRAIISLQNRLDSLTDVKVDPGMEWESLGVDLLMLDEAHCFPYDTPVLTEEGLLPIGEIVETRRQVRVLSRNSGTGRLEWQPITGWFRNTQSYPLVRIRHQFGEFVCTANHSVWTEEAGYVEASQLTSTETLRVVPDAIPVQVVRGGEQRETPVLRKFLCGAVAQQPTREDRALHGMDRAVSGLPERETEPEDCGAYAGAQPHGGPRGEGEDDRRHEGETLPAPWRQRTDHRAATVARGGARSFCGPGASHPLAGSEGVLPVSPELLQGGHCHSAGADRHRGGREESSLPSAQGTGPEEGCRARVSRVVSVEVLEPGGHAGFRQGDPVYCLQVESNHNFFASGVLVSNSFKSLFFPTKMAGTKGIPQDPSQKATNAYLKSHAIQKANNGRGVLLASGTPLTNSVAEIYVIQRFLQEQALRDAGLYHFDAWANTFGETTMLPETKATGRIEVIERFAEFTNIRELNKILLQDMDVVLTEETKIVVPTLETGASILVESPSTQKLREFVASLDHRAQAVKHRHGPPQKGDDNILVINNDGALAALDMRLVDQTVGDLPDSKVNLLVQNILQAYRAGADKRLAQLVFIDLSTPGKKKRPKGHVEVHRVIPLDPLPNFNVYDDVRAKLIAAGVPKAEIAYIYEYKTADKQEQLFDLVNAGTVRILLGSSDKMALGTNAQERLAVIHSVVPPWRADYLNQQNGRLLRQGNRMAEWGLPVRIYHYVTKGSYDTVKWSAVSRKAKQYRQLFKNPEFSRIRDFGDEIFSPEEIAAIASGNPLAIERVALEKRVSDLESLRSTFDEERRLIRRKSAELPREVAETESILAKAKKDADLLAREREKLFSATILGKTYDKREEAGKAILERVKPLYQNPKAQEPLKATPETLGTYRGFRLVLTSSMFHEVKGSLVSPTGRDYGFATHSEETHAEHIKVKDEKGETVEKVRWRTEAKWFDPMGVFVSIDAALRQAEGQPPILEKRLQALRSDLAGNQAVVDKPFPYQQELEEKSARLAVVLHQLHADEVQAPTDITEQEHEDEQGGEPEPPPAEDDTEGGVTLASGLGSLQNLFERRRRRPTGTESPNPRVEAVLRGSPRPGLLGRLITTLKDFGERMGEDYVAGYILRNFPAHRNDFRLAKDFPEDARRLAAQDLVPILGTMTPEDYDTFRRLVVLRDLESTSLDDKTIPAPDPNEAPLELAEVQQEIARLEGMASPAVLESLSRHDTLVNEQAEELILRGDMQADNARSHYFPHHVLDYTDRLQLPGLPRRLQKSYRSYVRARQGSARAIDVDYFRVMWQHLVKYHLHNLIDDFTLAKLEETDETQAVRQAIQTRLETQGDPQAEENADAWRPGPGELQEVGGQVYEGYQFQRGRRFYWTGTVPEDFVERSLAEEVDAGGRLGDVLIDPPRSGPVQTVEENVRGGMAMGRPYKVYMIPVELAAAMRQFRDPVADNAARIALRRTLTLWKRTVLGFAGLPYQYWNFVGDLDALGQEKPWEMEVPYAANVAGILLGGALAGPLGVIGGPLAGVSAGLAASLLSTRAMRRATVTAVKVALNKALNDPQLEAWWKEAQAQRVTQANIYGNEIEHLIQVAPELKRFLTRWQKVLQSRAYPPNLMDIISQARETIPRLASFYSDMARIERGLPVRSLSVNLTGLTPIAAAGKVARVAPVDYGDVTPKYARDVRGMLFPFATWYHKNFYNTQRRFRKAPIHMLLRRLAPLLAMILWNNTFARDQEERIPFWYRFLPHIATGYQTPEGEDVIITFQSLVAMAARFTGLDTMPWLVADVAYGRKTVGEAAKELGGQIVSSPTSEHIRMLTPVLKSLIGLLTIGLSGKEPQVPSEARRVVPKAFVGSREGAEMQLAWHMEQWLAPYAQFLRAERSAQLQEVSDPYIRTFLLGFADVARTGGLRHYDPAQAARSEMALRRDDMVAEYADAIESRDWDTINRLNQEFRRLGSAPSQRTLMDTLRGRALYRQGKAQRESAMGR